ncbi:hypothetical protein [Alteribacillus bidgolensis]|uniref:YneQ n=1 Tax=Alteribacillus bidgolensis TaxID=930129 RepID=A0A1G8D4N1_9BACI|nr:hypothetical protein [Alteribacillus bidgolensis]SDH52464.1 hypothetical protein SAMN05216352_101547 [Alteribacillus bidgolensis]
MAFGVKKEELKAWKEKVELEEIAFITHYWYDERFPDCHTVTKVGCANIHKLAQWGRQYGLKEEWIHQRLSFPHFDLLGSNQIHILEAEGQYHQIERFSLYNTKGLKTDHSRKR